MNLKKCPGAGIIIRILRCWNFKKLKVGSAHLCLGSVWVEDCPSNLRTTHSKMPPRPPTPSSSIWLMLLRAAGRGQVGSSLSAGQHGYFVDNPPAHQPWCLWMGRGVGSGMRAINTLLICWSKTVHLKHLLASETTRFGCHRPVLTTRPALPQKGFTLIIGAPFSRILIFKDDLRTIRKTHPTGATIACYQKILALS